ncbi:Beta-xylosidase [compost metagenome]
MGYIALPEIALRVHLRVSVDHDQLQFAWALHEDDEFMPIGPVLDASTLSDEACQEGWFTGAFVGICCQDLTGFRKAADFDYFEYKEEV